jgi:small subunit ribosomal protein S21
VLVTVRDNKVDQALRILKRKLQSEGILKELRKREAYEKPSTRKRRERNEAVRRAEKNRAKAALSDRGGR